MLAQDLVCLPKLPVLTLKRLQLRGHVRRHTGPLAGIHLGLLHPLVQRVPRAANLRRDRQDRLPAGRILMPVIQHQPHRPLAHLGGELVRRLASHGSTFSGVGASGKPGAVQSRRSAYLDRCAMSPLPKDNIVALIPRDQPGGRLRPLPSPRDHHATCNSGRPPLLRAPYSAPRG